MRKILKACFCVMILPSLAGCSSKDWLSKYYMLKAENSLSEAAVMKEKKIDYSKRVPVYAKACKFFRQSFDIDSRVFTLNRIEEASDSCWRAEDKENEDVFKAFEEEYAKKHPQEFEHGDSGVAMMDMGG